MAISSFCCTMSRKSCLQDWLGRCVGIYIVNLEFWYMPGRGCLRNQSWMKALHTHSLTSFSDWQHSHCVVTTCSGGIKETCVTPLGEGLETCTWLPQTSSPGAFSLHWFCCVFFHWNHGCEHNYMLSPVCPPRQASNLGWSGGPNTHKNCLTDKNRFKNIVKFEISVHFELKLLFNMEPLEKGKGNLYSI